MAQQPPRYRPGDVVNGHVLSADGQWVPVATPGTPPGSAYPPPPGTPGYQPPAYPAPGYQQPYPEGTAPRYRPGDVVNGFVLNASYQWEPANRDEVSDAADAARRTPPAVAIGAGVLGLAPIFGWVFAIIAVTLGGRILSTRSSESKGDAAVGSIALGLGLLGVVGALIQIMGI